MSVLDIKTGVLLTDHVNDLLTTTSGSRYQVTWLPDSSGFIYPRLAPGAEAGSAVRRLAQGRQYLHRLGTRSSSDTPVFGFGVVPEIALADDDLPAATITSQDSKWLVASIFRAKANRSELWAAPIEAVLSGTAHWRAIASEGISQPTLSGNQLYGVSSVNADRRAIMRLDLRKPDAIWQTFVPERVGVMHRFALASDALYFTELLGSDMQLYRAPYDQSTPERLSVPIKGSVRYAAQNAGRAGVLIESQNFGDPGAWFQIAADSNHAKPAAIASGARAQDRSDLVSRQISVPTQDGLQIPVSLLHHRDLVMDGNTPLLLEAYGGYGQVHLPNYNPFICTWVRQGAIYAYAHVRGGGELGRSWHQSALRENKILSTTDTLAVARFLIERRYTSKGKIALLGTSSGAQIPGLAITLAPELFGAAIFNVGTPDEIRGAQLDPTAARNIAEMGDMDSSEGVALLKRYSPYHRVPARLALPTTIVKSAADDYNFGTIAGAAKYVARLQAANSGNRPVLWANQAGGHSDFFDADPSTAAGWMAFVLWQTGHPDFQPKPTK